MFIDFFYFLRNRGINVSISEYLVLLKGMKKGLHESTIRGFYQLCRAVLLRDESEYDLFDEAFNVYFRKFHISRELIIKELNLEENPDNSKIIKATIYEPFEDPKSNRLNPLPRPSESDSNDINGDEYQNEEYANDDIKDVNLEAGDAFIGTPGYAINAPGPGFGSGGGKSTIFAIGSRKFRDFRKDNTLDTRQFQMAFRLLRNLSSQLDTSETELDLDNTIKKTCDMGGMLRVEYRKPRKNSIRVILLIDSGGSMSSFARLCSELFQAATASRHLKELKTYYFHNVVYSLLYKDPTLEMKDGNCISVDRLIDECDEKYRVIFVGDAEMHPYEFEGSEYNFIEHKKGLPGSETLKLLKRHFPHMIWLNPLPMPDYSDDWSKTHLAIAEIVDMFDLTLDGLEKGFRFLLSGRSSLKASY